MSLYFIGIMSGTSLDGVDLVVVSTENQRFQVLHSHFVPYTDTLQQQLLALSHPGDNEITRMGQMDIQLAELYAQGVVELLAKAQLDKSDISAIGCHGQTIRHLPDQGFSIQIGSGDVLAARTGIAVINHFRQADMALGGQGAPLVPAFHQALFPAKKEEVAVVNIGGIANVSLLKTDGQVLGFDTGPGNILMNGWIAQHKNKSYDANGEWASYGQRHDGLLKRLLEDDYFKLPAPKSTGREYFNQAWLKRQLQSLNEVIKPEDVQATLATLTVQSIADAINSAGTPAQIWICGGGVHNPLLMRGLQQTLAPSPVKSTLEAGVDPDYLEASCFAWLAHQYMTNQPANLPSVTGASGPAILGRLHKAF